MLYPTEEDVIIIDGLRVDAIIGIDDWERVMTQAIIIDMALFTDVTDVAQTQDLSQGVNYKAVCEQVSKWVQDKKFELLETLVEYVSRQLLDNWPISKVSIRAVKPNAITLADAVGVQITRKPSA
ncbi:dihydroneopterin aldolase [Moraxella lincolnii]|uniref:7,8-dihydroneopterin aldolase n=1 Tax=Lwoffella lincolnii TaxID=90241 RepID=A0A1T0CI36_9GAMM|nr:dihydroneopterin aldolase [Moraxella lincolnii]OOS22017.1 dihydroneopterin aldolase [Moraxella lincolnii]